MIDRTFHFLRQIQRTKGPAEPERNPEEVLSGGRGRTWMGSGFQWTKNRR
jgi:hypothetical protein